MPASILSKYAAQMPDRNGHNGMEAREKTTARTSSSYKETTVQQALDSRVRQHFRCELLGARNATVLVLVSNQAENYLWRKEE